MVHFSKCLAVAADCNTETPIEMRDGTIEPIPAPVVEQPGPPVRPAVLSGRLGIDDLLTLTELGLEPVRLEGGLGHGVALEVEVPEGIEVGDGRLFGKRAQEVWGRIQNLREKTA